MSERLTAAQTMSHPSFRSPPSRSDSVHQASLAHLSVSFFQTKLNKIEPEPYKFDRALILSSVSSLIPQGCLQLTRKPNARAQSDLMLSNHRSNSL